MPVIWKNFHILQKFDPQTRFIIVVRSQIRNKSELSTILKMSYKFNYFYNTIVISQFENNDRIDIHTFDHYRLHKAQNISDCIKLNDIFYDQFQNLYGHRLRLLQYHDPPRSIIENGRFLGIDAEYFNVIREKMNASYHLVKYIFFGLTNVRINSTKRAQVGLVQDFADMSFNIMESYSQMKAVNVTNLYPYEIDQICVLVPKTKRISPILNIIKPLNSETQLFVLLICILSICLIFMITFRTDEQRSIIDVLFLLLELQMLSSTSRILSNRTETIIITGFIFYSFILMSSYQCVLTSLLIIPLYEQEINTIKELMATKLTLIVPSMIKEDLERLYESDFTDRMIIKELWDMNSTISHDNDYGLILSQKNAKIYINSKKNLVSQFHLMQECLYSNPQTYALSIQSKYEQNINNIMGRIREAGLSTFWEKKDSVIPIAHIENIFIDYDVVIHFFLILYIGYIAGFLIFMLELVYHRYMCTRTRNKSQIVV